MEQALAALLERGLDLSAALRVLRQLVMERTMVLDCEQQAPLAVVTRAVTELAELALERACIQARAELDARHGAPQGPDGRPVQLWIIGMGKLGARELNVSSDIDLIYVYEQDGDTAGLPDGRGVISNHEYFARVVKGIYGLIGDTTEHGFVFRVDLALRPNGNSGPSAVSLASLEEYLQTHGREWERFAWLKSRVVAPMDCVRSQQVQLRAVVLPFVFRRYLDYAVFDALRSLHRQIREHAARRSAGHPGRSNDVKLARRHPRDRIHRAAAAGGAWRPVPRTALPPHAGGAGPPGARRPHEPGSGRRPGLGLHLLRRVEHRIQYLDDQQTHVLPTRDDDLEWIARTMGFADACAFCTSSMPIAKRWPRNSTPCWAARPSPSVARAVATARAARPGHAARDRRPHGAVAASPGRPCGRLARQCPHRQPARRGARPAVSTRAAHGAMVAERSVPEDAALRFLNWLEPLLRRESYLALLLERPAVHERLLDLLGAARWPARYLQQHPGVIDELANEAMLGERFSPMDFEHELALRLAALQATGEDDDETLLNLLRRAHHAEVFRTLARDIEGRITVEQVADDLSALADCVLRVTASWCWSRLKNRHRESPQFAIIGYGKLGGKELGYGSDLDIVFVFDDEDEHASEIYAAFVRKLINWLAVKTGEGDLFEIDTALRPNGNSGLLVTSFASYANYQQQRGSNTAWTWEHQAMTRARFVLGSDDLQARFDAVREAVITAPRDASALRDEIVAMRERVRGAHPVRGGLFDVKHSPGGMVDVEFAVQYLVLSQSASHPELMANLGNIALLQRAEQAGLIPAGVGQQAAGPTASCAACSTWHGWMSARHSWCQGRPSR